MKSIAIIILNIILAVKAAQIGDPCTINLKKGSCQDIRNCQEVLQAFQNQKIPPTICDAVTRTVCCPNEVEKEFPDFRTVETVAIREFSNRTSAQKCQEYSNKIFKEMKILCRAKQEQFIMNGLSNEGKFPHMAQIGFSENQDDFINDCAASLISNRFLITAAHCTINRQFKEAKHVKLGNTAEGILNTDVFIYEILLIVKHPSYKSNSVDHDIALLKSSKDIIFNSFVVPICLPYFEENTETAIATGWNKQQQGGKEDSFLRKYDLNVYKEEYCQEKYPLEGKTKNGIDYKTKICAGTKFGGKDSCSGDTGGPLQIVNKDTDHISCMYTILGVTSYGHVDCGRAELPGIYTRVYNYLDLIEAIVWG